MMVKQFWTSQHAVSVAFILATMMIPEVSGQQQCSFCPNGSITEPDKPIVVPGYEFLDNCGIVDSLAGALPADDPQCELMQSISSYCGCPAREDSCSLCPDGNQVSEPDKPVPWVADSFGGVVLSCGLIEAYVASLSRDEKRCVDMQLISHHCGCAPLEDHCTYCPGEELSDEFRDVKLPILTDEETGFEGTCEMYILTQYQTPKDDISCEWSRFISIHCGCNNGRVSYLGTQSEKQENAIAWAPRIIGMVAIVCSVTILIYILRSKSRRRRVYYQLMILVAIFDIVTSAVWIVGPAAVYPVSEETGLPWGSRYFKGTTATCTASAFFYHLGFTSIFLNVSITTYAFFTVVYGMRETRLKKMRKWLLGLPLVFGISTAAAAIPLTSIGWSHCQIQTYPREDYLWALLVCIVLPIAFAMVVITIMLSIIYLRVRSQLKKSRRWDVTARARGFETASSNNAPKRITLEGEVFWQCCFYAVGFGLTWPIQILGQIRGDDSFDTKYWFWLIVVCVGPIQGITNALCFFRPHLRKVLFSPSRPSVAQMVMNASKEFINRASVMANWSRAASEPLDQRNEQEQSSSTSEIEISEPLVLLADLESLEAGTPGHTELECGDVPKDTDTTDNTGTVHEIQCEPTSQPEGCQGIFQMTLPMHQAQQISDLGAVDGLHCEATMQPEDSHATPVGDASNPSEVTTGIVDDIPLELEPTSQPEDSGSLS